MGHMRLCTKGLLYVHTAATVPHTHHILYRVLLVANAGARPLRAMRHWGSWVATLTRLGVPTLLLNCSGDVGVVHVKQHSTHHHGTYIGQMAVGRALGQYLFLVEQLCYEHGVVEDDDL